MLRQSLQFVNLLFWRSAPVVSFVAETNAIVTAGWSVTVSGVDFGYADATTTSGLGLSSCPTAAWVSSSSVACYLARGQGPLAEALATVSLIVGTQTSVFSYDGSPIIMLTRHQNCCFLTY